MEYNLFNNKFYFNDRIIYCFIFHLSEIIFKLNRGVIFIRKKKPILTIIFVILFLLAAVFGAIYYYEFNKIVAVVTMDINPSVSLSLNSMGKVIKAEGINEDGKKLLEDNKLKGKSLEKAIDNISDLVIDNGYFSNGNNHILVNVEGEIKEDISKILTNEIKENNIECEIIFQELSDSSKENASKYGISENKASYIEEVIKNNNDITFEDLKDKSINEINKFIEEKKEEAEKEESKKEEDKKPTTNSGTNTGTTNNNNSSNTKPNTSVTPSKPSTVPSTKPSTNTGSSSGGTGTVAVCSRAVFNLENDDATAKVFGYLGLDFSMKLWYDYQTIAKAYNSICTYETKIITNKTLYKYYHNVTDGSLVHQESISYLAGTREDLEEIIINYFIANYGATKEEIFIPSSGGTINEPNKEATVKFRDVTYNVIVEQRTGVVKSVTQK